MARPERAQRAQELVGRVLAQEGRCFDDDERSAAQRLGDVGDRRELQEPADRRDLIRHVFDPAPPCSQHLGSTLEREEQHAGVHLGNRIERELERRHDAERTTATSKRPVELRLVLCVCAHELAVCVHELDSGDAVRREPMLAREPADASAEGVADDTDVG